MRLVPDGDKIVPLRPDGSRDVDPNWKISDTWKSMEAMVKKGWFKILLSDEDVRLNKNCP